MLVEDGFEIWEPEPSAAEVESGRLEHFERWFRGRFGEPVGVAYPGVALSFVLGLHEPAFAAHLDWVRDVYHFYDRDTGAEVGCSDDYLVTGGGG